MWVGDFSGMFSSKMNDHLGEGVFVEDGCVGIDLLDFFNDGIYWCAWCGVCEVDMAGGLELELFYVLIGASVCEVADVNYADLPSWVEFEFVF